MPYLGTQLKMAKVYGNRTIAKNTEKTAVAAESGAKPGTVGVQNVSLTVWLDACPVDLDDEQ